MKDMNSCGGQELRMIGEKRLEVVDSVRSREPSPCGIAFGDSILPVPNGQDSTDPFDFAQGSACCLGCGEDDGIKKRDGHRP
jgi:hypothetical protein